MQTRRTLLRYSFGLAALSMVRASNAQGTGYYSGRVVTEWLPDNRRMKLIEPFDYVGPDGRRWPVPAGTIVDGASIPQVFWSIIGGPFEGPYRNASVIHDHYCSTRVRKFRDVHRVFFDGMRTSGVSEKRAWLMYQAVDRFGPSWSDPKIDPSCEIVDEKYDFEKCAQNWVKPTARTTQPNKSDVLAFAAELESSADRSDIDLLLKSVEKLQ